MKITKRDLQLSMALIGILAAVFSYFFVYTKLEDKTVLLKAENEIYKQQAAFLEEIFVNKDNYEQETADMTAAIDEIISQYDVGHVPQNDIMYLYDMEAVGNNNIMVSALNLFAAEPILGAAASADTAAPADAAPVQTAADASVPQESAPAADPMEKYKPKLEENSIAMFKVPLDYTFQASYDGIKNVINYIYGVGGRKSIETLSLSFDTSTGLLNGNMKINMFYLTGTDRVYTPPVIPSVSSGVGNIFRTVETGQAENTEAEVDAEEAE